MYLSMKKMRNDKYVDFLFENMSRSEKYASRVQLWHLSIYKFPLKKHLTYDLDSAWMWKINIEHFINSV